ncbi:cyclin-like protein [Mycena sp. CBHHK59/15]|nr:cyclin-like protein [Mycena sp. CBHHK59/15]
MHTDSQWLFPLSAFRATPSNWPIEKEMYDRARGIEFLFRLGSSLVLPTSAILTAATWFHRFYMRYSMEDHHRQDVAASCIFLATKTEECGRKLRDVARICQEVEQCQASILLTEEVLLEALCLTTKLVDLFDAHDDDNLVQECAWSFAHDSYRTPLCLLYPPQIIAAACYILSQRVVDGPNSVSLDARVSSTAPTSSLPTPPSHKPPSPDATRFAIDHFSFNDAELSSVSEALSILLEFYGAQDFEVAHPHLLPLVNVPPPSTAPRPRLYAPFSQLAAGHTFEPAPTGENISGRTPNSSHGGRTPANKEIHRNSDKSAD